MNNDLISRSELYAAIGKRIAERHGYYSLRDIKDAINNAPSVEPERPQGEWIERNHGNGIITFECSNCGNIIDVEYEDFAEGSFAFCDMCGAKMVSSKNN